MNPLPLPSLLLSHVNQQLKLLPNELIGALSAKHSADLSRILALSDFAARALSRDPQLLSSLLDSGDVDIMYSAEVYPQRLTHLLETVTDQASLMQLLRQFRLREMLRIIWRDQCIQDLSQTLQDLTWLAQACVDAAVSWHYQQLTERYGIPRDEQGQALRLIVLGMGKLGGCELNYSSDIDLILAYPAQGDTDSDKPIENEVFFKKLGQALVQTIDSVTEQGFVFRVDLRLRPFGDAGAIAMSMLSMENYYQRHGREWERYALIKARPIAGDIQAGEQLLQSLRPFIYRRYLDYGTIESLREMKAMIAREVERKGLQRNVKLGPGGIREIEFIGQAFQLIYGGREPRLQQRSLFPVLDFLAQSARLPDKTINELKQAYIFLRHTENHLQQVNDVQTHDLPSDELGKARLAWHMGYANWKSYVAQLMQHVVCVKAHFKHIFEDKQEGYLEPQTAAIAGASPTIMEIRHCWMDKEDDSNLINWLAEQNFIDPQALARQLILFRNQLYQRIGTQGQRRLDKLMPMILMEPESHQPETLSLLLDMLETIAKRSAYLALFTENPHALKRLMHLCSASPWISRYLAHYPLLLDELLTPVDRLKPLSEAHLRTELSQLLHSIDDQDEEAVLDALRHFQHVQILKVAMADIADILPLMIVSDHLTEIAEVILDETLGLAWRDMIARFGTPMCEGRPAEFAIIAYGKLGGLELGYGSDLDLVFLHDSPIGVQYITNGAKSIENGLFFVKLAQRILHYLSTQTAAGVLYEVDTRLRPSGQSGLLVSNIEAFEHYQFNQAWTWEHQALLRARPIAGSKQIATQFNTIRRAVLSQQRDPIKLHHDVLSMRQRMRAEQGHKNTQCATGFELKHDQGGIVDIEFLVQYLVLKQAIHHSVLLIFTDNIRQLAGLEATGLLPSWEAGILRDTYRALRRRVHLLKLKGLSSCIEDDEFKDYRPAVIKIWQTIMDKPPNLE